jgi:hypothetical protein
MSTPFVAVYVMVSFGISGLLFVVLRNKLLHAGDLRISKSRDLAGMAACVVVIFGSVVAAAASERKIIPFVALTTVCCSAALFAILLMRYKNRDSHR